MNHRLLYYRHYKGGLYFKLHDARLESTGEPMVVYASATTGAVWTRPLAEFEATVTHHGQEQPRFAPVAADRPAAGG